MEILHITIVQADLAWEDKSTNLAKFDNLLKKIDTTDVIVLPEMFTTGFTMNPKAFAESLFGDTYVWMFSKARSHNAVVTGSFMCLENGHYYNRLLWIQPDGTYYTYDKRHLFGLAGENAHYTEGVSRLVVEWRGWRFCPLICYDLRFPVWSRNYANFNPQKTNKSDTGLYDVLIYVANWPARRIHHWKALLTARAIENQAYVVAVNRIGDDGHGIPHTGSSRIVDYYGEILADSASTEGVQTAIFSKEKLTEYRNKFGFLQDVDKFSINM
jgi:predicted amidohydrolase